MIKELFSLFTSLESFSSDVDENWAYIKFTGTKITGLKEIDFTTVLTQLKLVNDITFHIDSTSHKSEELFKEELYDGCEWNINVSKANSIINLGYNFFYKQNKFKDWSDQITVFDTNSPFNQNDTLKIIVYGIETEIIGEKIIVCSENSNSDFKESSFRLPTQDEVRELVHTTFSEAIQLKPINHLILEGENNELTEAFYNRAYTSLALCLCNEIRSSNDILIRGVRSLPLKLNESSLSLKIRNEEILLLSEIVSWVYKEKPELRLKLLLDRITLDIDITKTFLSGLKIIASSSLQQAKERFNFIVYERQDEYQKELRELLKDLEGIANNYSSKVRDVVKNLLRDVLATIILIGFTFFSKISESKDLLDNKYIGIIFKVLSIYFILSIVIQSINDWYDIKKSRKEFEYWKEPSRQYITPDDFKNHLDNTINKRKVGTIIIYSMLAFIYVALSIFCWDFKCLISIL